METVREILQAKGYQVWSVTPDTSVYDALQLMADKNIGAVLVLKGAEIAGIFSERDYARKLILHGKSSKETPVGTVMSKRVTTASLETTIQKCMALMTEKHIRHLPVVVDGRPAGMVSIGDVVKTIIDDQAFVINQLEKYINGTGR
jgi:CBS domain-containing protein